MEECKILLVEDEAVIALDISSKLKKMGYSVVGIVNNGEESVKKSIDLTPDIVLMDINLRGDMDGIQAAEKIGKEKPVIFLTAFSDEETLQRAKKVEPYGYILKPVKERELKTNIDIALYKCKMEKERKLQESKIDYLNELLNKKNIKFETIRKLLINIATSDLGLLKFIEEVILQNKERIEEEIAEGDDWFRILKGVTEPMQTVSANLTTVINLFVALGIISKEDLKVPNVEDTTFYQILFKIYSQGGFDANSLQKFMKYLYFDDQASTNIIEF